MQAIDRPHRIALPTYQFQRERYWIDTEIQAEVSAENANPAPPDTALPGRRVPSPLPDLQFECLTGVPIWPQLADHRVFEQVIVPGAWHLALVLAGVRQACGTAEVKLNDVLFPCALSLNEDEVRTVQLVLTPPKPGAAFQVWSRAASDVWQLHAEGKYAAVGNSNGVVARANPPELEQRGLARLEQAEF
jgi:acyl transferase domain-containing protein